MIQPIFDLLFALALVVPAVAVIVGALALLLPTRSKETNRAVRATVHA